MSTLVLQIATELHAVIGDEVDDLEFSRLVDQIALSRLVATSA